MIIAWRDIPAFVAHIQSVKREDLNIPEGANLKDYFRLTAIAHSMGGMAAMMYIIKSRLDYKWHGFSKAVMLSPAGIHTDVSLNYTYFDARTKFFCFIVTSFGYLGCSFY